MKFKDNKSLIDDVRFNKNTIGKSISINKGSCSEDKRLFAASSCLSMMYIYGYFDDAKKNINSDDKLKIINKMIDTSRRFVSDSAFVKNDEEAVLKELDI